MVALDEHFQHNGTTTRSGGGSVTAAITLPNTDQSRMYNLDGLGNWKTSTFIPVGGSQSTDQRNHNYVNEITQRTLTGSNPAVFQYDGATGASNGNLKNDGTLIYAYDAYNRLIQVNRVSDGLVIATYVYDAMNRRVRKTIFNGGLTSNIPNGTTDYIWQGWQCMEERNSSDAPIRQHLWGTYIDELIQLTTLTILGPQNLPAGAYYLLQDLLYRAVALTDSSGVVVEAYDTDAYGNTLIFTAPGADGVWFTDDDVQSNYGANEIIYCGYRFDPETELYYGRNRTYSPVLGRWLQRDPIGYQGGLSLYGYMVENPGIATDPQGLREVTISVGVPNKFDEVINAFEKLAKDLRELEQPFHFIPGVHPYFNFIPWKWSKSPELEGKADFEGGKLCSADVRVVGDGSVGAQGGAVATADLVSGKVGLILRLTFSVGVIAEYKSTSGWSFGGGATGTLSLALSGGLEAWLIKATVYGGVQGHITGTMLSGDLVVSIGAGGIAGVAADYRTPFSSWENLFNVQAGFLNTPNHKVGTVDLGPWIENEVQSFG